MVVQIPRPCAMKDFTDDTFTLNGIQKSSCNQCCSTSTGDILYRHPEVHPHIHIFYWINVTVHSSITSKYSKLLKLNKSTDKSAGHPFFSIAAKCCYLTALHIHARLSYLLISSMQNLYRNKHLTFLRFFSLERILFLKLDQTTMLQILLLNAISLF